MGGEGIRETVMDMGDRDEIRDGVFAGLEKGRTGGIGLLVNSDTHSCITCTNNGGRKTD